MKRINELQGMPCSQGKRMARKLPKRCHMCSIASLILDFVTSVCILFERMLRRISPFGTVISL